MKLEITRHYFSIILKGVFGMVGLLFGAGTMQGDDSIPSGFKMKPEWHVGGEILNEYVLGTDAFLRGSNVEKKDIKFSTGGMARAGFSFNPKSKEGMLYPGLYQGIAIGARTFYHNSLLGTPGSAYVYQGAPFAYFNHGLYLGYEWDFGIAFGWKHNGYLPIQTSSVISTAVTAHMGVALKLRYDLDPHWTLSLGVGGTHFSNGNTSWRNAGLNSAGFNIGVVYKINPLGKPATPPESLREEADRKRWFCDVMAFGAWRQRLVYIGIPEVEYLAPGKYPVFGIQAAPSLRLNRWVAVGPALDVQWDKSAALSRYWESGLATDIMKFSHVPFIEQVSVGVSAHAELTTPIFAVNGAIGYNILNPKGDRAFYQALTVKAFVTPHIYLNVGYRLGAFKDPHNIMLGIGYRIM